MFVIKAPHHNINVQNIKADLLLKGHVGGYITNVKSKYPKIYLTNVLYGY